MVISKGGKKWGNDPGDKKLKQHLKSNPPKWRKKAEGGGYNYSYSDGRPAGSGWQRYKKKKKK